MNNFESLCINVSQNKMIMKKINFKLLIALLLISSCKTINETTTTENDNKIVTLLLGTYHWDNPGLDELNTETGNYLTDTKQKEIQELVEKLNVFNPTKILIEQNPSLQYKHDSLYTLYKNSNFDLNSLGQNEIYQLGYKLAKMNNHDRVYCVDADGAYYGQAIRMVAQNNQHKEYLNYDEENKATFKLNQEYINTHSILDNLRKENDQNKILKNHYLYNNYFVLVRDTANVLRQSYKERLMEIDGEQYFMKSVDGENIGVEGYVEWLKRNVRIYANILDVCKKEDRILVIFGTSHIRPLQIYLGDNPEFEIVNTSEYLK